MTAVPRPVANEASERAIRHLFGEFGRARSEKDAATARMQRHEQLIKLLINTLPAERQAEFRARLDEIRSGGTSQRGGKAFGQVIQLFRTNRTKSEWTVQEIANGIVEQNDSPADPKSIANAIAYLASSGRIQRIARG